MKAFNRGIAKSFMLVALLIGASAAGAGAPAVEVGQRTISLRHADLASAAGAKEVWRLVRRAATEICGSSWYRGSSIAEQRETARCIDAAIADAMRQVNEGTGVDIERLAGVRPTFAEIASVSTSEH